jgi:hypothetical protein
MDGKAVMKTDVASLEFDSPLRVGIEQFGAGNRPAIAWNI